MSIAIPCHLGNCIFSGNSGIVIYTSRVIVVVAIEKTIAMPSENSALRVALPPGIFSPF
jgi:hypothetical protein